MALAQKGGQLCGGCPSGANDGKGVRSPKEGRIRWCWLGWKVYLNAGQAAGPPPPQRAFVTAKHSPNTAQCCNPFKVLTAPRAIITHTFQMRKLRLGGEVLSARPRAREWLSCQPHKQGVFRHGTLPPLSILCTLHGREKLRVQGTCGYGELKINLISILGFKVVIKTFYFSK